MSKYMDTVRGKEWMLKFDVVDDDRRTHPRTIDFDDITSMQKAVDGTVELTVNGRHVRTTTKYEDFVRHCYGEDALNKEVAFSVLRAKKYDYECEKWAKEHPEQ